MLKQLMKLTKKKFGNREVRDLLSHAAFEQLFLTMRNKSSTPKSTALKFFSVSSLEVLKSPHLNVTPMIWFELSTQFCKLPNEVIMS